MNKCLTVGENYATKWKQKSLPWMLSRDRFITVDKPTIKYHGLTGKIIVYTHSTGPITTTTIYIDKEMLVETKL